MANILRALKTIAVGGRALKCEACGNDFTCGASLKGCWCAEIKLNDQDRATLKSCYSDCLCRNVWRNKPALDKQGS
jgi:hypothetical protein